VRPSGRGRARVEGGGSVAVRAGRRRHRARPAADRGGAGASRPAGPAPAAGALASDLSAQVASKVRRRGAEYFLGGNVRLTAGTADEVEATVAGTRRYRVRLVREGEALRVSCTCPFFADRSTPCKHVWATILAASAKGHLRPPGGAPPRWIEVDKAAVRRAGTAAPAVTRPVAPAAARTAVLDTVRTAAPEAARAAAPEAGRAVAAPLRPSVVRPPLRDSPRPDWRRLLDGAVEPAPERPSWTEETEILYLVDVGASAAGGELIVEILEHSRKAGGGWRKLHPASIRHRAIASLPDPADREVLGLVAGGRQAQPWSQGYDGYEVVPPRCRVPDPIARLIVPRICIAGRCRLRRSAPELADPPLAWDGGEPWKLALGVRRDDAEESYRVGGWLRRGEERMALDRADLLLPAGLVFAAGRAARLDDGGAFGWIALLRRVGELRVPIADGDALLERLLASAAIPLELPEELRFEEVREEPRPGLRIDGPAGRGGRGGWVQARPFFLYGDREVEAGEPGAALFRAGDRRLVRRDLAAEGRVGERLADLGFRPAVTEAPPGRVLEIPSSRVPPTVRELLAEAWLVEVAGKLHRVHDRVDLRVSSGIDWFDVRGGLEFGGETVPFPALLAALRRGERFVPLGDGSLGILPEEWLRRFSPLAAVGRPAGEGLRFQRSQASIVDALVAGEPTAVSDEDFARVREGLAHFAEIAPVPAPPGFQGELREYQRIGLGWFHSLRDFGFGGCLADDMGLGKTVQVLALLASRREPRQGPSLVVAPRSLTFNWLAEAARFTPELAVLDYTGIDRERESAAFAGYDLVLTTYGTLRRDVELLRQVEFDYVVLDEAQAIKNRESQSAKAARLLKGRHRLALTGTPVENHLGELGSLLEFLNPGLFGASPLLRSKGGGTRLDAETLARLSRALRPFLLRRTKEQVVTELPEKTEQTLFCELPARQRRLYDELRDHYRNALGARIGEQGLARTKILVLEALLRLRQAACHPGLLDPRAAASPSAKLDVLLPQLREVLEEGHKALVFSQFTSFLALLEQHLDREGIPYAYLDGRTRDRQQRVERFQNDPGCNLFLVSLKAGGLGLNLTAAEYVYLLDPWWNPAVEAQAIDRAHRIGQTRRVFAYRLVARDTVEEKILALQQTKRELADAVIRADQSLLRNLTRDDLELLLS
jgi:superfamily II DNA or RNA helicase